MKTYEVQVIKTGKAIFSQDNYNIFDQETKNFASIIEAKDYLKETYGTSKRIKMYCDMKDGSSKHIGYIYCFNNSDISHNSETWNQQDWVNIHEVEKTRIII